MSDSDCSYVGEEGEDFEEKFTELKLQWKTALKKSKKLLLKCPNYERCQFKCGSVGGMQYHYVRCTGKSPQFKCDQCSRSYESKTGLNYHMASNHGANPVEDPKSETSGRPQRSTALSTMTAIILANNPPPLKQVARKTKNTLDRPNSSSSKRSSISPSAGHQASEPMDIEELDKSSEKQEHKSAAKSEARTEGRNVSKSKMKMENAKQLKVKGAKKAQANNNSDMNMENSDVGGEEEEDEEEEEEVGETCEDEEEEEEDEEEGKSGEDEEGEEGEDGKDGRKTGRRASRGKRGRDESEKGGEGGDVKKERGKRRGGKDKKGSKAVNIPSIEYPDEYKYFLPIWRQEMKDNKIIKCPNYEECEFKCTTVNGMKYHYVRCMKANPPEFKCEVCNKKFQCRTGLVWHLKKTHNLVDMHPSKEGGFQGIITGDISGALLATPATEGAASPTSRKRRGFGGRRGGKRRRLRKSVYPRRTAEEVLQNIMNIKFLPEPKLGPELLRSNLPPCEYVVADSVPTDVDPKASAIITLGEEALEWQQMTSDESDSDYDYEDDYLSDREVVDGESAISYETTTVIVKEEEEDTAMEGYFSKSSSSSDSDEDYTVPYQRKQGVGRGRGRGRRGRGGSIAGSAEPRTTGSSPLSRPSVGRPRLTQVSGASKGVTSAGVAPPPLVSPQTGPPSLVKSENIRAVHKPAITNSHVQPPSALIVPKVGMVQKGGASLKREPPPLVKKPEEPKVVNVGRASDRPQIVLPSPTSVGVGGESLMLGGTLSAPHHSSPSTMNTVPPAAPVKRRPGRPRKDQSVALSSSHTHKTSRVHHIGHGRGRGRGGRGGGVAGLVHDTPTSARSLRLTQYEFQQQQQQQSVIANQGVCLTQPASSATAATPTQFQPLLLQPSASLHSNIVTPLQIVSTGQATPTPLQIQTIPTIPQGSVIYLQNSSPQQQEQSPQYLTKDGQVYQVISPASTPGLGDRTKKLSVIMQPSAGGQPTYVQAGDLGNIQYVAQLDGTPPCPSSSSSSTSSNFNSAGTKEGLKRKFELVRQRMAIMQLDGPQPHNQNKPGSGRTQTESGKSKTSPGESNSSKKSPEKKSSTIVENPREPSSSGTRNSSSDLLQAYFDKVQQYTSIKAKQSSSTRAGSSLSAEEQQDDSTTGGGGSRRGRGKQSSRKGRGHSKGGGMKQALSSSCLEHSTCAEVPEAEEIVRSVSPAVMSSSEAPPLDLSAGRSSFGVDEMSREEMVATELPCTEGASVDDLSSSPALHVNGSDSATVKPKKIFECLECGQVYNTRSGLKYHMAAQHATQLKEDDSLDVCVALWRQVLKRTKIVTCHICKTYTAKAIPAMKYHWKKCGKVAEEFRCEVCDKVYTTSAGLKYHLGTAHQEQEAVDVAREEPKYAYLFRDPKEHQITTARKAAVKASCKMTDVVKLIQQGEEVEEDTMVPKVDYSLCRERIRDTGESACPIQGCDYSFRSVRGIQYHIEHFHAREEQKAKSDLGSENNVDMAAVMRGPKRKRVVNEEEGKEKGGKEKEDEKKTIKEKDKRKEELKKTNKQGEKGNEREEEEEEEEREDNEGEGRRRSVDVELAGLRALIRKEGHAVCPKEDCDRIFRSMPGLNYHLRHHHIKKDQKTKGKIELGVTEEHEEVAEDEDDKGESGDEFSAFKNEIRRRGRGTCLNEECDRTFVSLAGLRRHLKNCQSERHSKERSKSQPDVEEDEGAESQKEEEDGDDGGESNGEADVASRDSEVQTFRKQLRETGKVVCPREGCGKTLGSVQGMKYHITACHSNEDVEEEEDVDDGGQSDVEADTRNSEIQALKKQLQKTGRVVCPREDCGKSLSTVKGMLYHLEVSHDNMEGEEEEKEVVDYEQLKAELLELGQVTCSVKACARTFSTLGGLHYHLTAYHGVEPDEEADDIPDNEEVEWKEGEEPKNWSDRTYLKDLLQKTGHLVCPRMGCAQVLKSVAGMVYHIEHCKHAKGQATDAPEKKPREVTLRQKRRRETWTDVLGGWRKKSRTEKGVAEEEEEEEESDEEEKGEGDVMKENDIEGIAENLQVDLNEIRKKLLENCAVECPVKDCSRSYTTWGGLEYHMKNWHLAGRSRYMCPQCNNIYTSRKIMTNHIMSKHPEEALGDVEDMEYYCPSHEESLSSASDSEIQESKPKRKAIGPSSYKCPFSYKVYSDQLVEYLEELYDDEDKSLLCREEWRARMEDWQLLDDYSAFLSAQRSSMPYKMDTDGFQASRETSHSLGLFQVAPATGRSGAVFFTGGPVWAMDWMQSSTQLQFLALAAYKELDETHAMSEVEHCKGAIQLWDLGCLQQDCDSSDDIPSPTPRLALAMALDYGPVRSLKWYQWYGHESTSPEGGPSSQNTAGLLGVACADGCVRMLAIPSELVSRGCSNPSSDITVVQPLCLSAVLVPVGAGVSDWSKFGQCLCMDWSPGGTNKVVAGFSNGVVCVWDLTTRLFRSHGSRLGSPNCHMVFHPVVQLPSQEFNPCRCVAWCPSDQHYIFTCGVDKREKIWDIRQPFSPVDLRERSTVIVFKWLLPWANCVIGRDYVSMTPDILSSKRRSITYRRFPSSATGELFIDCNGDLSDVAYSMWTDRLVFTTFAGELSIVTFPTIFHMSRPHSRRFVPRFASCYQRLIFGSHLEALEEVEDEEEIREEEATMECTTSHLPTDSTPEVNNTLPSSEELSQTRRLVFTSHWTEMKESPYRLSPNDALLAGFTQVCCSPNRSSKEWLVVGTNSGLAFLLHLPLMPSKPSSSL